MDMSTSGCLNEIVFEAIAPDDIARGNASLVNSIIDVYVDAALPDTFKTRVF